MRLALKGKGLKEAGFTGEEAKGASEATIRKIPAVQRELHAAKQQVLQYEGLLEKKYGGKLRLHSFAVVSVGFDRLVWEAAGRKFSPSKS